MFDLKAFEFNAVCCAFLTKNNKNRLPLVGGDLLELKAERDKGVKRWKRLFDVKGLEH